MNKLLKKRLNDMLRDEKIAPRDYSKLKKLLPMEMRRKITMIQKQERSHYTILKKMKKDLLST